MHGQKAEDNAPDGSGRFIIKFEVNIFKTPWNNQGGIHPSRKQISIQRADFQRLLVFVVGDDDASRWPFFHLNPVLSN